MSPMTRSVSILIRAREGGCWARRIKGAATKAFEKERRENADGFLILLPRCLPQMKTLAYSPTTQSRKGGDQRPSGLQHHGRNSISVLSPCRFMSATIASN